MNATLIQFAKNAGMSINDQYFPNEQLTRQQAAFARAIIDACADIANRQDGGLSGSGREILKLKEFSE
jgi:hypothetical protein